MSPGFILTSIGSLILLLLGVGAVLALGALFVGLIGAIPAIYRCKSRTWRDIVDDITK